jgi:CBS domain-containing protein
MKAKDVMTRQVISIAPDASIFEALKLMLDHKISGLPVINKIGNLVGIVSEGDFLAAPKLIPSASTRSGGSLSVAPAGLPMIMSALMAAEWTKS